MECERSSEYGSKVGIVDSEEVMRTFGRQPNVADKCEAHHCHAKKIKRARCQKFI